MKRPILWTLMTAFVLLSVVSVAAMTADEVFSRFEESQDKIQSLSAILEETISMRGSLQSEKITGRLFLEKPNRLWIRFTKPSEQYFVCDGKVVWLHTPSLNQVLRQDMSGSELLRQFQLQLGQEVRQMRERFTLTYLKQENLDGAVTHVLKLVPKKAVKNRKLYYEMKIWFDEKNWFPVKTAAYTAQGGVLTMRFIGLVLNPPIPRGQFDFTPPAGAEVIDGFMNLAPGTAK